MANNSTQGEVGKGLKFVQLLSGGKDSIFSLIHSVANYHRPLALVNLGPPSHHSHSEELDSFLYQSIGHSAIPHIAHALDLPLFTRAINGSPIRTELGYGSRLPGREEVEDEQDETEDLYELLKEVKLKMPEVEAVSVGAILSNYQRLRVEHICLRLNLIPLAYLWEQDQHDLLQSMISSNINAILIKVAGAGLTENHLGKSLAEMQSTLERLNQKWGTHECGEGGEYETFTLDCPLFRETLVLTDSTLHVPTPDPVAPVAHLSLDQITRIPKTDYPSNETHAERVIRMRRLLKMSVEDNSEDELDETSKEIERAVCEEMGKVVQSTSDQERPKASLSNDTELESPSLETSSSGYKTFVNVVSPLSSSTQSLTEELDSCFAELTTLLHPIPLTSLNHLTLLLSSPELMSLFPTLNQTYSSKFGTQPPTRACLALKGTNSLGGNKRIRLEGWVAGVGNESGEGRDSLHVQSRSYWSAANIGPYSQAISTPTKLFIAGQIGLIPSSLELATTFERQCAISLQHLRRILEASDRRRWSGGKGNGVCWIVSRDDEEWEKRVRGIWKAVDLADELLGDIVCVEAGALPKGAQVEWQVTFNRELSVQDNVDSSDEEDTNPPLVKGRKTSGIISFAAEELSRPCSTKIDSTEIRILKAFHFSSVPAHTVKELAMSIFGSRLPPLSVLLSERISVRDKNGAEVVFIWE